MNGEKKGEDTSSKAYFLQSLQFLWRQELNDNTDASKKPVKRS